MHAPVCMCKQICEYANKYVSKSVHVYETLESMHATDFSPVGTRRRFNVEAWLKFRRDVVSTLIQR